MAAAFGNTMVLSRFLAFLLVYQYLPGEVPRIAAKCGTWLSWANHVLCSRPAPYGTTAAMFVALDVYKCDSRRRILVPFVSRERVAAMADCDFPGTHPTANLLKGAHVAH